MNIYAYRDTRTGCWTPNGKDTRPIVFFVKASLSCHADIAFEKAQGIPWDDVGYLTKCVQVLDAPKPAKADKTWGGAKVW